MRTPNGRNRIDLNSLFQTTQRRMVAELAGIRETVNHAGTLGDETELAWRNFLSQVLPNRYQVCDGFVVDADGWRSDQMDVIVFDRQYSPPLFTGGSVQYVPAEAVYAVFEIKQRIDNRNLRLACSKAASVRILTRTSAAIPTADGTLSPKTPHRMLSGILTLSTSALTNFEETLRNIMVEVPEEQQLDLGCSLNDGSFTVEYRESKVEKIEISPGALSLVSFLFQFLSALQSIGTVPAIDYSEYLNAALRNADSQSWRMGSASTGNKHLHSCRLGSGTAEKFEFRWTQQLLLRAPTAPKLALREHMTTGHIAKGSRGEVAMSSITMKEKGNV